MTDNEIIKALECCIANTSCMKCPMLSTKNCMTELYKKAIDLINRQKAEIERLTKLQKPTGAGGFKVENGNVVFYSDMLNGYRHEFKDLEEIVKELNLYMHTDYKNIELISHYQHKAQTTKAEAIKEFVEQVKMAFYYEFDELIPSIMADKIDNLVKEMTEQKE